jgi:hypothetical protein
MNMYIISWLLRLEEHFTESKAKSLYAEAKVLRNRIDAKR